MLRPSPLRLCLLVGVLFGAAPVFAQEPATRAEELRRAARGLFSKALFVRRATRELRRDHGAMRGWSSQLATRNS